MENLDIDACKKAGLSFEDIEGIKRGLNDLENGNIYEENEFYANLEKRLFSKKQAYV